MIIAAALMLTAVLSSAKTIDFTSMTPGKPVSSVDGVTFSIWGGTVLSGTTGTPAISLPSGGYLPWADVNGLPGLANTPTGDYPTAEFLSITFPNPESGVNFTFDNWGGPNGTTYTAYGAGSSIIASGGLDSGATSGYVGGITGAYPYEPWSAMLVNLSGDSGITSIVFDNATRGNNNWEYAVGEVTFSSVPEPATMLLLGLGLVGLAGVRRKFKK